MNCAEPGGLAAYLEKLGQYETDLKKINEIFQTEFIQGKFALVGFEVRRLSGRTLEEDVRIQAGLARQVTDCLWEDCHEVFVWTGGEMCELEALINYEFDRKYLETLLVRTQRKGLAYIKEETGRQDTTLDIYVPREVPILSSISNAEQALRRLVWRASCMEEHGKIWMEEDSIEKIPPLELAEQFSSAVIRRQASQLPLLLQQLEALPDNVRGGEACRKMVERWLLLLMLWDPEQKSEAFSKGMLWNWPEARDILRCRITTLCQKEEDAPACSAEVSAVRRLIRQHYAEALTLELAAEKAGCSAGALSRKFSAETGETFSRCLLKQRIQSACRLLITQSGQSIAEVAYSTGFNDPRYFARQFRREMGMTPGEYRRREADR